MSKNKPCTYTIVGTNITYNLGAFQHACQHVRDAERDINNLPEQVKEQVIAIVQQVAQGVLEASREIYFPLIDKEKLERVKETPSDYRTDLNGLDELAKLNF